MLHKFSRIIIVLVIVFTTLFGGAAIARADDERSSDPSSDYRGSQTLEIKRAGNNDDDGKEYKYRGPRVVEIKGIVKCLTRRTVVVGGKTIRINGRTEIDGVLSVGARVKVEAIRHRYGRLVAREIEVIPQETPPSPTPPLAPTNNPPVLSSIGNKSVDTGVLLTFTLSATDPDGDALTYSASNLPVGASFDAATGVFSWTPGPDQTGSYTAVHFRVSDASLTDSEDITIMVTTPGLPPAPTSNPPVLNTIGNQSVNEGQLLTFTLSAADPDGDVLAYSASNLPVGASFDAATGIFSWTPGSGQAGTYTAVHFQVSDGSLTDSEDITITVTTVTPPLPVNQPPVLNPIGNKSVDTGALLTFTLSATDPDGDALTLSASNLPVGAGFDPVTRVFSWTPTSTQAGTYTGVHYQVTDGSLTDSEDITITVTQAIPLVSFSSDIQPMLTTCNSCHPTGGVDLSSYAGVNAAKGLLPGMGAGFLTAEQEQTLALWISQGAVNN